MWSRVVLVMAVLISAVCIAAPPQAYANSAKSPFMRVFGTAAPPYGFIQFCSSFSQECRTQQDDYNRFSATPERLAELDRLNRAVNAAIKPATDQEIFGVAEYWTVPGTRGDCEDYAILKRKLLIARGWPANALLLTVVRDEVGDGHAVLTARTSLGDFILDNKVDEVLIWHATPYKFVMRQSYLNARAWMALDPALETSPASIAGISNNSSATDN